MGAYLDPKAASLRRWLIPDMYTGSKPQQKGFCDITDKEKRKFLDRLVWRELFTGHSTGRKEGKSKWRGNNNLFLMKWLM